ncbi:protein RER1 isoform X1 [Piliocolobus tephrosceles]|uniref:protein RER1 isoform X1 n=1 Tax=Piliocolobus tephrosceles TaxID=591936 RepID=UPI000C2AFD34|nr:protein RER1 isoform X1 [Piliocolobus tephrosceles]
MCLTLPFPSTEACAPASFSRTVHDKNTNGMDRTLNVEETYLTVLVKIGPRFHTLECFLLKSILCFSPSYRMSEGDSVGESVHGKPSVVYRFFTRLGQIYQSWLDKSTPYTAVRWVVTLGLSFVYMIRVYLLQGWYIVTYALGIYHLNLFIAFLSPKVDPSLMEDSDDGPSLPTKQNEEFRPFIRRLPEFKFWHAATKGILVAMVCTFFDAFNVPVFWPILVMYFIMLFCITMKRQIKHMIKYRYIPFTHGKRRYRGKEDAGKAFAS